LPYALYLCIDVGAVFFQFSDTHLWIGFGALDDLIEQREYRQQTRFGTDKVFLSSLPSG
jgi:hypothetical protein